MAQFTAWLQASAIGVWTRESPSIWAYPTVLTLHTVGLGVLVGANAVVDFRLLGFAPRLPVASLTPLYRFMWAGFVMNAITGAMLFASDATAKAAQPVFYVKLTLIALALATTAVIRKRVERAAAIDGGASRGSTTRRAAAASLLLWTAAIAAGRLMAYL
ncbi:MAG: hypothetical protein DMF93_16630 [Acidobacteria bacterium]|nr:MAG: hypothetical protein DMF93_16630 [Acidobacteriota bacterium]